MSRLAKRRKFPKLSFGIALFAAGIYVIFKYPPIFGIDLIIFKLTLIPIIIFMFAISTFLILNFFTKKTNQIIVYTAIFYFYLGLRAGGLTQILFLFLFIILFIISILFFRKKGLEKKHFSGKI